MGNRRPAISQARETEKALRAIAVGAFVVPPLLLSALGTVEPSVTQLAPRPRPLRSAATSPLPISISRLARRTYGSPLTDVAPQTVTMNSQKVGTKLSPAQIGLSLESTDLADPLLNMTTNPWLPPSKGLAMPCCASVVTRRTAASSGRPPAKPFPAVTSEPKLCLPGPGGRMT